MIPFGRRPVGSARLALGRQVTQTEDVVQSSRRRPASSSGMKPAVPAGVGELALVVDHTDSGVRQLPAASPPRTAVNVQ